jgi:tetratricopeptide (TPR) repeat protein
MSTAPVRRYLLGALLLPAAVLIGGAAAFGGPWSPLAMDRADARYVAGDLDGARAAYAEIARGWHTPSTRAEGALRVALLADQAGDSKAAVEWLRRSADLQPDPERRAEVLVQLSALYLGRFEDPVRAAEAYEQAARTGDNPRYLVAAARLWERAKRPEKALRDYQLAASRLGALDESAWAQAQADAARVRAEIEGVAADDVEATEGEGSAEGGDEGAM